MAFLSNSLVLIFHLISIFTILYTSPIVALFQELQYHSNKIDSSVNFLAIGDWGRKGGFNQSQVAHQMGAIGAHLGTQFVISTGDNFYKDGLKNVYDPLFQESFTKIYTAQSLQIPWYTILGNHDYHGNVEAQLDPIMKMHDKRWHCMRSYILKGGTGAELLDIIFVDTNSFIDRYFKKSEDNPESFNWTGVLPRKQYLHSLIQDLEIALTNSKAVWKIVVGHHPIFSIGNNGDTPELINQILPLLKTHKVDMYINGHDHCLQRINGSTSHIQFLTSGGCSRAWKGIIHHDNHKNDLKFYHDGQGFMSAQITPREANITFYNVYGHVLHSFKMPPKLRT